MKKQQPLSMQQIADARGWDVKTVRKWRQKLGLGVSFNRTYLLTEVDADEIAKHKRDAPGNPLFGTEITGNAESAAHARSRKKTKAKR